MSTTKMQNPSEMVTTLRNSFNNGTTKSLEFRRKQLENLIRFFKENGTVIIEALKDDLNKSVQESIISEIALVVNEARNSINNLHDWSQAKPAGRDLANIMNKPKILPEPYGVVLVIGAWNYPLQVTLSPVAGAIAAGNCVIIKPSELAPATSKVISELLPKYLDTNCYRVYVGGPEETGKLLEEKLDYIFFTGSPRVGKMIAQAAAKHLTPTTLELGGKSPCYVDSTVDIEIAAARILWGKLLNAGQTCIAPDYMLCTEEVEKKFIEAFKKVQIKHYGSDIKSSPDFCRIINSNHLNRLASLLKGQKVVHGGNYDISQRFFEPTICVNVNLDSPLMQEEIFGPILPIIRTENAAEAIRFINSREKPLALYVFSNDEKIVNLFEKETSSGGICVNDTLMHCTCDSLPFGGVGQSGIGAYHGKFTFDTFSHHKPILEKTISKMDEMTMNLRYAPYSDFKMKAMLLLMTKRNYPLSKKTVMQIIVLMMSFIFGYIVAFISKF